MTKKFQLIKDAACILILMIIVIFLNLFSGLLFPNSQLHWRLYFKSYYVLLYLKYYTYFLKKLKINSTTILKSKTKKQLTSIHYCLAIQPTWPVITFICKNVPAQVKSCCPSDRWKHCCCMLGTPHSGHFLIGWSCLFGWGFCGLQGIWAVEIPRAQK